MSVVLTEWLKEQIDKGLEPRGLSLWQPYASLIGRGKTIETRSRKTSYRGPLVIQAAQRRTDEQLLMCYKEPFKSKLAEFFAGKLYGELTLPLGAIVAVCILSRCIPTENFECVEDDCVTVSASSGKFYIDHTEKLFGDYSNGRYGYILHDIQTLDEPVPYKGSQGLFKVKL